MNDELSDKISVKDAMRLKNELNQKITYGGGLNAKQIRDMEGLTQEQSAEVSRQLSEIRKSWWLFPDYVWITGLLVGVSAFFYFHQLIVQIFALAAVLYCTAQLAYRSGLLYGYVRGYESGHEEGVHKSLGITPADAEDIRDRAVEMEMDERLIQKMDERKRDTI